MYVFYVCMYDGNTSGRMNNQKKGDFNEKFSKNYAQINIWEVLQRHLQHFVWYLGRTFISNLTV